jgi:serine/threonine-protein kinase
VREEPQPPSVFDSEITPEMDAIVLKALTKDPDYRYQSADEMRADIEACLDGQPVAATAAMGAVGYGGHPDDQQTAMLHPQNGGGQTSMLPPVSPDDGGYGYDERPDRRRQNQGKSRTSTILLVLAGVLVLIGAILIGKWFNSGSGNDTTFAAPKFVGKTVPDARLAAKNTHLELDASKKEPCDKFPKGQICTQSPAAGTNVKKGDTITVTVSTGAPKVAVPDVRGLDFTEAESQLNDKGFEVVKETKESSQTPDVVISQDPSGGTEKQKGSTVTLTVAKKKTLSTVPDVSNKTCDEAKAQLADNDLKGTCTEEENATVEAGKVFSQSLAANSQAEPGSTVVLKVAKAAQQITVPGDIAGKKLKDVQKQLTDLGLVPALATGSSNDPNATVVTSQPGPNSPVNKGDTVTLLTTPPGQNGGGDNGGGGFFGGITGQ